MKQGCEDEYDGTIISLNDKNETLAATNAPQEASLNFCLEA